MKSVTRGRIGERRAGRRNGGQLIARQEIQAYCDAVARDFHPQRIVLFGSYAYGKPTADSDVDLMVILPFRGSEVAKAAQIRARLDAPFPLDLLARRPEFITERLRERDMFIEGVMTQGRIMYEGRSQRATRSQAASHCSRRSLAAAVMAVGRSPLQPHSRLTKSW